MPFLHNNVKKNQWFAGSVFLVLLALLGWRLVMPKPGLDVHGASTWIEIAFLLSLYTYINLAAFGAGHFLLKRFSLPLLTKTESVLLSYLLGLGMLSAGVMVLGLMGWLRIGAIFFWLAVSGIIALRGWMQVDRLVSMDGVQRARSFYLIFLQIILGSALILLLIECLLPVWDYDAWLYHLDVPRQFLAAGRFYFDPEVFRSAYPFFGEMLFLVGIAFDLDSLAKLVNFTYAILFVLSSYTFSRRFVGTEPAYTTMGILIGVPALWMWSTWAGIDFAWASYEFWSVYAISLWLMDGKENSRKWLTLAGVMSGLAASTKYLSVPSLLIVGALLAWKSVQNSRQPFRDAFSNLLTFALASAVIAGAWYIKNWIWTGNPAYPLILGGPGWEPVENQVLHDYLYSFGVGKGPLDFLLLPYNVYAFQDQFSTIGLEIIHPALWLAFLFPLLLKRNRKLDLIVVYTVLSFVFWAVNTQVIRFLLPLTAFLAILAGAVIETFPLLLRNATRIGLLGGFMLFNLLFQLVWFQEKDVWPYLKGDVSAAQYLQTMNYDFRAVQYIQNSFQSNEKALFLWDGRRYFCYEHCIPDDEQAAAVRLTYESPSPEALASDLRRDGITHLLLSKPDANWFMTYHDPRGIHRQALDYFTDVFFPACGDPVYSDNAMTLYEITCR